MSKCPVDPRNIIKAIVAAIVFPMNKMMDLPWKPFYTQSGTTTTEAEEPSVMATWSLAATIAFMVVVYCFEGSLDARQKAAYLKTTFPKELELTVGKIDADRAVSTQKKTKKEEAEAKEKKAADDNNEEDDGAKKDKVDDSKPLLGQLQAKFTSSQAYGLDKINFGMLSSTYDIIESIAFLMLGFLPYMWDMATSLGATWSGWTPDDEIKITLVFLLLVTLVGTVTSLPFELYSTFQIERKHGFNKQTYGLFFSDKVKSLLLTCVIGGPFIALLLKIIKVGFKGFERERTARERTTMGWVSGEVPI
jgi:CAAX prenyl protease N-terminal, five membrane helices